MSELRTQADIIVYLAEQGYSVTQEGSILIIQDEDELNIFAVVNENQIEFMIDLCSVNALDTTKLEEIYENILDQNTEILPSCFGIDSNDPADKRIVLVDSLATENLDANELLLSLDSLSVNVVTAHELLLPYLKQSAS
ncbi:MAG: CesT family type III secretion system chaperone [Candidatus Poribacteria bacterium]|nr:CesT family type III secretion system chaperone [Candidatus Poribacteria bacterium]